MRKIMLGLSLAVTCLLGSTALISCGETQEESKPKLAFLSDSVTIEDNPFHKGNYAAFKNYLLSKGYKESINFININPTEFNKDLDKILLKAIEWGAKGIICNSSNFADEVYDAQYKYKDVKFMLMDATPTNGITTACAKNTVSLKFKEHESGFLAGYAAVKDGHKELSFLGGMHIPQVERFGVGYLAGIHKAASLSSKENCVRVNNYQYAGTFDRSPELCKTIESWFKNGTEVIFSAAGLIGIDVASYAEKYNRKMIGVDIDQSYLGESILTSATKNYEIGINKYLDEFFGTWIGGITLELGIKEDGVALPTSKEAWRFKTFTLDEYNSLVNELKVDTTAIPHNYETLKTYVTNLGRTLEFDENIIGQ